MKKMILTALLLSSTAFANTDAIVSGNAIGGELYLFNTAAEQMYNMLVDNGARKEIIGDCTEVRNDSVVCGYKPTDQGYMCTFSLKRGEVAKSMLPVCPRP